MWDGIFLVCGFVNAVFFPHYFSLEERMDETVEGSASAAQSGIATSADRGTERTPREVPASGGERVDWEMAGESPS